MSLTTPEMRTLLEILAVAREISDKLDSADKYRRLSLREVLETLVMGEGALLRLMRTLGIEFEVHKGRRFLTMQDLEQISHYIRNPSAVSGARMAEQPNLRYSKLKKPPK